MIEYDDDLVVDGDAEEEEAYITYDIATYPSDLTLSTIKDMWDQKNIIIPDFQRNFVWTIKQSSLLIESFLLGLPIPQIFLYVDENNNNLVIDGQQRLLSIIYFLEGYFGSENIHGKRQVFRLQGLDPRSPYNKKSFSDLDEALQKKLKYSSILRAINIKQLNPKNSSNSVYHIFERLNTGGTPLKPQEIRNCVFIGDLVNILKKLNADSNWHKILGKSTYDRHQRDVELILRLFALSSNWDNYEKPMKEYLNSTMDKERKGTSRRVEKFVENFPKATKIIVDQLGLKPFHIRGPLNVSVLDSVFCTIIDNIGRVPKNLDDRFISLLNDLDFVDATYYGTSDASILQKRFRLAKSCLIEN